MVETPKDDFWTVTPALDPPSPVRLVSAAGGLVVAAGASLHMLRPGSQRVRSRELPSDHEVVAVAAEPWSPYRLAVATAEGVAVYTGHRPYESMLDVTISEPELAATHVAWSRRDGKPRLYVRQKNGKVLLVDLEEQTIGTLNGPKVAGIAADADGVFAMIDLNPVEPANVGDAWILPVDATEWTTRWVDYCGHEEDKLRLFVAVRGAAFAWSTEALDIDYSGGAEVSWEPEDEDENNSFDQPPGVFMGPIAFQSERVIIGAYNVEGQVHILRWGRDGSFTRIARFGLEDDWKSGTEANVTALAWDDERGVLWAASPELGLLKLQPPSKGRSALS